MSESWLFLSDVSLGGTQTQGASEGGGEGRNSQRVAPSSLTRRRHRDKDMPPVQPGTDPAGLAATVAHGDPPTPHAWPPGVRRGHRGVAASHTYRWGGGGRECMQLPGAPAFRAPS